MLQNYEVDITEFIKFTSSGVHIADYTQVRDALIKRYKEVYGSDIDLSTASADGVFVSNLALIINNILQSVKAMYANLDVNTASGTYLDNLCALSNITRKPQTHSNASVIITNEGNSPFTADSLILVDKSGVEWNYNQPVNLAANGNTGDSISIIVECSELGAVEAPIGWIDRTLEMTDLSVEQSSAANVGEEEETDSNLRARRAQSTGADGTTVLESLIGALLEISGIRDVKIYNNNTGSTQTAKDSTSILNHNIYVILRKLAGITVEKSDIGTLIYEKLTPGISTTEHTDSADGTGEEFDYIPAIKGVSGNLSIFTKTVYWKEAIPVHPTIEITIVEQEYFNEDEIEQIKNSILNYLNNLHIGEDLTTQDVLIQFASADPLFLGKITYTISSVSITGAVNNRYTNPDTYYNYTNCVYNSSTHKITIS